MVGHGAEYAETPYRPAIDLDTSNPAGDFRAKAVVFEYQQVLNNIRGRHAAYDGMPAVRGGPSVVLGLAYRIDTLVRDEDAASHVAQRPDATLLQLHSFFGTQSGDHQAARLDGAIHAP